MNPERDRRHHTSVCKQHSATLSEEVVSEYLKSNKDFLIRWLTENTTKEIVELFAKKLKDKNFMDKPSSVSISGKPGAPGGLGYQEHMKNSITSQIFRRYLEGDKVRKPLRKDRMSLQRMPEDDLLMELIRDIASELDVNMLCHKILQNVSILTNSDRSSLFLVRGSRENKCLVSKLFDVTESSTLEEVIHTERNEIRVPFGKGVVGIVAQTGKPINISDAYEDPRFNQEIDRLTGFRTHSILSMPIVNYEGEVIGVAQIINKSSGDHEFTEQDEDVFRKYLIFCGIGLTNAQLFEMSVNEFKRNQLLLHLARGIFEEQTNLEKLVQKIMLDAQDLLKCQKCCVYLLEDTCERGVREIMKKLAEKLRGKKWRGQDPTASQKRATPPVFEVMKPRTAEDVVFTKAFDLCARDGTVAVLSAQVLALSKTAHIAKFVVTTGEPVNVADADNDGRFGDGPFVDSDGSPIKTVLCMPIHNSEKHIIGVTQLINKINGLPFNHNDVNIIEAFSIFTGLGIHNCQMYENACQLMAKQSVALEVLSFHATAHAEETNSLQVADIPKAEEMQLYDFDFDDQTLDDDGTLRACVRMFMEADIINSFKIPYDVVCRWLCTVKKNYRPVTYHNWRHAFNVCQTMFTILYTGELVGLFEPLEVFTLLAACLCHDLDHRGTNNAFQTKVASPLAMLYSTSVLEHHHFDHSIMILNSEGNNIFQSLTPEDYRHAIKMLEHAILSTDLALYFKKRGDFKKLVESGEKTFSNRSNRALLRAMMMTACDVAAIAKPWKIQQEVAQLVMAEFFEQGDIERQQLGEQPIPMMDRNKKDELPKMQVGFIDAICTPIYKLFVVITEKLAPLYDGCESNRRRWQEQADLHEAHLRRIANTAAATNSNSAGDQSDSKPQEEGGDVHPQALPSPDDPEQGVQPKQAIQSVAVFQHHVVSGSSHHRQTQTDEHQSPGPRQQSSAPRPQDGAGCNSSHRALPRSHSRQPEESQLGDARPTDTNTSSTTISIITTLATTSPPLPLASLPSQLLSLASMPAASLSAKSSSHPSFPSGHEKDKRPSPHNYSHCHPTSSHDPHSKCSTCNDAISESGAGYSPAFSRLDKTGFSHPQSQHTVACGNERLGSSIKTQPPATKHLHQNGHASAEQKTISEACCPQNLINPWQQPQPQATPSHRKIKTLAQAEAEAQFSSSKNFGKTGVCVVS